MGIEFVFIFGYVNTGRVVFRSRILVIFFIVYLGLEYDIVFLEGLKVRFIGFWRVLSLGSRFI